MSAVLKVSRDGAVLRLTLNDNPTRNSMSEAMLSALGHELQNAELDHSISVIIINAEGFAFSAGHNLKELTAHRADADQGAGYFADIFGRCAKVMTAIAQHRCITIAEVQGLASAAGCQLVASCDFAYASSTAHFCTPGVNIGLFCSTPMVALSRAIGPRHAREMLLTGEIYDAEYALRVGLVNGVVEVERLHEHVVAIAKKIASKSQNAISIGKPAFDAQLDLGLGEAYAHCSRLMVENFLQESAHEGVGAVLEKRKPIWPSS
jgi:enoyl-CoA hydratase/carnithine racemase